MASGALADGKFFVCRRQSKSLPIGALADGKFFVCRRQSKSLPIANASLDDGKILTG